MTLYDALLNSCKAPNQHAVSLFFRFPLMRRKPGLELMSDLKNESKVNKTNDISICQYDLIAQRCSANEQ